MEVKTKKIIGADGAVEAIAVPADVRQEIVRKLNIAEPEGYASDVQKNVQEAYEYIRSKVTVLPEILN